MPLLSPAKLARELGISLSTFYVQRLHERLPVYRIGARRCYDLQECLEFLKAERTPTQPRAAQRRDINARHELPSFPISGPANPQSAILPAGRLHSKAFAARLERLRSGVLRKK